MKKKLPPLLDWESLTQAAECLRVLSHPVRLRMVQLMLHDRYTVGELAEASEIAQPIASEHLRLMERCGLLERQREGRRIYYRAAEPHLAQLMACVQGRFGQRV